MEGYIYVFHVLDYQRDNQYIYKIGRTNDWNNRKNSYTTSYEDELILDYMSELLPNMIIVEKRIHERLDQYRKNKRREFFRAPIDEIKQVINEEIIKSYFNLLPYDEYILNDNKKKNKLIIQLDNDIIYEKKELSNDDKIKILCLDTNNLSINENIIINDTKLYNQYIDLKYLIDINNDINFQKFIDERSYMDLDEIICKKNKINNIKRLLNILDLNTILDIKHELRHKYKDKIDLSNFNININTLNGPLNFKGKYIKNDYNIEWGYYYLLVLLIEMIRNIHPTIINHFRTKITKENITVYSINHTIYNEHLNIYQQSKENK
jgi:hypothetical protein